MSTPLPDDLKDFEAPTFWRTHGEKAYAAAFFALLAYAAVLPSGQSGEINEAGQASPTGDSIGNGGLRELVPASPLYCQRLRDGLWLRVMVKHTNHAGFSWHECYYGKLDRRDIL